MRLATPSDRPDTTSANGYKWVALTNTTFGMLMATVNSSIVIISLPAIFRGIGLEPLQPGNIGFLLWMLMGYLVATSVLVVTFGRLGDMLGRVRMYNLGLLWFTIASTLLAVVPAQGPSGALTLIGLRIVQGVGGALVMANSTAILTDAFPADQRGMAMGINQVAAIAGSFIGLILGGILAEVDWWGNLTFAAGLIMVLIGITYGIQPYAGHTMGWTSPLVVTLLGGGAVILGAFLVIERMVAQPCSTWSCSGPGRSPLATWPGCSPRSPAAGCSS